PISSNPALLSHLESVQIQSSQPPTIRWLNVLAIHNCRERFGVEARPANQRTVQLFLRHQPLDVIRLDAATIKDSQVCRSLGRKLVPYALPQEPVGCSRNFRRGRTARSNRPDWLVS